MKLEGVTAFKIRACPDSMEIMELHKNCWESCGTMQCWTALDWGGTLRASIAWSTVGSGEGCKYVGHRQQVPYTRG